MKLKEFLLCIADIPSKAKEKSTILGRTTNLSLSVTLIQYLHQQKYLKENWIVIQFTIVGI